MNIVNVLRGAKGILETRGWTQGVYMDGKGGACCLLGACLVAAGIVPDADETSREQDCIEDSVTEAIQKVFHRPYLDVADWNDDYDRTKYQVIAALDKAIAMRTAVEELP